jgi:hypothetical protein
VIEAFGVDAKFLLLINKLLDTRKAPLCVAVLGLGNPDSTNFNPKVFRTCFGSNGN